EEAKHRTWNYGSCPIRRRMTCIHRLAYKRGVCGVMGFGSVQSRLLQLGLLPYLVLAIAAGSALIGYQYAKYQEDARILNAFHEYAGLKAQRISLRVEGYERTLLDLRGLFSADENVSEAEFKR